MKILSVCLQMENSGASPFRETPVGFDEISEEEYFSQSTLLKEFTEIPVIEKAWTLKPISGIATSTLSRYFIVSLFPVNINHDR